MDYFSDMDLPALLKTVAEEHHLTPQRCGLNADWSVDAFMLSPGNPNITQGAFYIVEDETVDRRWSLVRRWYEVEGRSDENPHDATPVGIADGIGGVLSVALDPIGAEDLGQHRAMTRARIAFIDLLRAYQAATGDRKPCEDCDRPVFYSHKEEQWFHDAGDPGCFLARSCSQRAKSYDVTVRRVLYQYTTIQVEASSEEEAEGLAYDAARFGNTDGAAKWEDHDPRNPQIEVQEIEEA